MSLLEDKAKEREFIKQVEEQFYRENRKFGSEFSAKKVVKLMDVLEEYDPVISDEETEKYRKQFEKAYKKSRRKSFFLISCKNFVKRTVNAAVILLVILLSANVLTQATTHKNLFEFVSEWNNPSISDVQMVNEYEDITFTTISGVEQYLNKILLLPEDENVKITDIHIDTTTNGKNKVYITSDIDDNYLSFCIRYSESIDIHANYFNLDEGWEKIDLPNLKLSDVNVSIDEGNFRMYTYINEALYEIQSDLPEKEFVEILNTIPLP